MADVTFWLNAFIPRTVPAYTKVLTRGLHKGKTAIPLPGVARTWPGNMTKDWEAGYLTDQRSYSSDINASCRMQCIGVVEVDNSRLSFLEEKQIHRSSGTTEVNLNSGKQLGFDVADMRRCSFGKIREISSTELSVHLAAKAGDPLVGMAADIDFVGSFHISLTSFGVPTVKFQGKIDDFPAYECYAEYENVTKLIFKEDPPAGNTVENLLGWAGRSASGAVTFEST